MGCYVATELSPELLAVVAAHLPLAGASLLALALGGRLTGVHEAFLRPRFDPVWLQCQCAREGSWKAVYLRLARCGIASREGPLHLPFSRHGPVGGGFQGILLGGTAVLDLYELPLRAQVALRELEDGDVFCVPVAEARRAGGVLCSPIRSPSDEEGPAVEFPSVYGVRLVAWCASLPPCGSLSRGSLTPPALTPPFQVRAAGSFHVARCESHYRATLATQRPRYLYGLGVRGLGPSPRATRARGALWRCPLAL